jgi:hypothetical protein
MLGPGELPLWRDLAMIVPLFQLACKQTHWDISLEPAPFAYMHIEKEQNRATCFPVMKQSRFQVQIDCNYSLLIYGRRCPGRRLKWFGMNNGSIYMHRSSAWVTMPNSSPTVKQSKDCHFDDRWPTYYDYA